MTLTGVSVPGRGAHRGRRRRAPKCAGSSSRLDMPGFYRFAKVMGHPMLVPPLYGRGPRWRPRRSRCWWGHQRAAGDLAFAFTCRARLVRHSHARSSRGLHPLRVSRRRRPARARVSELRAMQFHAHGRVHSRSRARVRAALSIWRHGSASNAASSSRSPRCAASALDGGLFLARCWGRGDVCPAGDLAVRKAFEHYMDAAHAERERHSRRARAWGQYQNLAVHYLLAGMRLKHAAAGAGGTA